MNLIRHFLFAALLAAGPVHAQSPGEIAFWESVRDSRNPAELRAYLKRFPDGMFAPLAEARLAALESAPAAKPAQRPEPAVVAATAPANRYPSTGDTWTYRLSYPRLRGQWGQRERPAATHVVRADTVSQSEVAEQFAVDGGTPRAVRHPKGSYIVTEGVSLFSPYLAVFEKVAPGLRLPAIETLDAACQSTYRCQAKVRSVASETMSVPAGRFEAMKVTIEEQWTPFTAFSTAGSIAADMTGGRTLTVWYSPQVKRAVKYSSRLISGALPPMDAADFDLELLSYDLK